MGRYRTAGAYPVVNSPGNPPPCADGNPSGHLMKRQVRIHRVKWHLRQDRLRCIREACDYVMYDWDTYRPRGII